MPRQPNIRWSKSDVESLKKAVRNFNAKVNRLNKKYADSTDVVIPEKISVNDFKNMISTRQDYNRELNALKRFSKRGSEQLTTISTEQGDISLTKWQKREMDMRKGLINRQRRELRETLSGIERTSGGVGQGYKLSNAKEFSMGGRKSKMVDGKLVMGEANKIQLENLKSAIPEDAKNININRRYKTLVSQSQSGYFAKVESRLKENYLMGLKANFSANDIADIVVAITEMDFDEFYKKFMAEGGNFELLYAPDEETYNKYLSSLKAIWIPNKEES